MAFWNNPSELTPKQSHRWVISFGTANAPAYQFTTKNNSLPCYLAKSVDLPSYELGVQQAKYLYSHTFNFPKRLTWKPITITFYDVILEQSLNDHNKMLFRPILSEDGSSVKEGFVSLFGDETEGNFIKQSTQAFFYRLFQDAGYINPNEYNPDDKLLRFRSYTFKKNMVSSFIDKRANSSNLIQDTYSEQQKVITRSINANTEKFISKNYSEQTTLNIHQLAPYDDGQTTNQETWRLYNPIISDVKLDKMDYSSDNILSISITVYYDWAVLEPNIITPRLETDFAEPEFYTQKQLDELNTDLQALENTPSQVQKPEIDFSRDYKQEAIELVQVNTEYGDTLKALGNEPSLSLDLRDDDL